MGAQRAQRFTIATTQPAAPRELLAARAGICLQAHTLHLRPSSPSDHLHLRPSSPISLQWESPALSNHLQRGNGVSSLCNLIILSSLSLISSPPAYLRLVELTLWDQVCCCCCCQHTRMTTLHHSLPLPFRLTPSPPLPSLFGTRCPPSPNAIPPSSSSRFYSSTRPPCYRQAPPPSHPHLASCSTSRRCVRRIGSTFVHARSPRRRQRACDRASMPPAARDGRRIHRIAARGWSIRSSRLMPRLHTRRRRAASGSSTHDGRATTAHSSAHLPSVCTQHSMPC